MLLNVASEFDGLQYVTKDELTAEFHKRKAKITAGNAYQPENVQRARRIISEYLVKKRGFIDAKIFIKEKVSAATVKISFVTDELPTDNEEDCFRT